MEIYQGKGGETKHIEKAYVTKQSYDKPSLLNSGENIISEIYEDNQGNIVRSYEGGIYTDMTYNMQGELTAKWTMGKSLSSDNGMLEIYVYNEKGDLTETITEPGYKEAAENTGYYIREDTEDEVGNIIPGSIVSESEYDEAGNAVSQTDPMGNRTGYTYDETGNLTSVTNPDGTKYSYEYDVIGEGGTTKDVVLEPRGTEATAAKSKSTVITDAADRVIRIEDTGTEENDSASIYTD